MLPASCAICAIVLKTARTWVVTTQQRYHDLLSFILDELLVHIAVGVQFKSINVLVESWGGGVCIFEATIVFRINHILQHDGDFSRVRCCSCKHPCNGDSSCVNIELAILTKEFVCSNKTLCVGTIKKTNLLWVDKFDATSCW